MSAPRRRWSFSLRTLFVVVTLAAFAMAFYRAYPAAGGFWAILVSAMASLAMIPR